jgi:hypothetical protein
VRAAVEGVGSVVELRVVGCVVDFEGSLSDAVYVAAWDGVVDGVAGIDGWLFFCVRKRGGGMGWGEEKGNGKGKVP